MTQDQATQRLRRKLGWTALQADLLVQGLACLEVLKLDEPHSDARRRLVDAIHNSPSLGDIAPITILKVITAAGLKVVDAESEAHDKE